MHGFLKQSTASQTIAVGPFVDDTDFISLETGLTINNTDVKLSKNGGSSVNKNSGGGTHIANGMYALTFNATDTDTVGELSGSISITGAMVVVFKFTVLEESIYDALFASAADGFDANGRVDVGSWLGTAVTTSSTTNKPEVDINSISNDATAANNLKLMYDTTGYVDDTAPASRAQVDSIRPASSGSFNFEATEDNTGGAIKGVTFVGTQTNTYTATEAEDGTYHQIDHTGNDIDIVYGFAVGGSRQATEVTWRGYLNGSGDEMVIQVYDFVGTDWETVATISGKSGSINDVLNAPLLTKHTGTGADLGKVYIRFETLSTTPSDLDTDQLLVTATNLGQSVGYADGAVWVDTVNGTAGTENYVNGTADNPVNNWTSAQTIANNVGIPERYHINAGSSITLDGDSTAYQLIGNGLFDLALGSQTITGINVENAKVSGTGTGSDVKFIDCHFAAAASIAAGTYIGCGFAGTSGSPVTESGTGQYILHNCYSEVAGSGTPYFNFSGAGGTVGFNNRGWLGGFYFIGDSNTTISHEVLAGGGTTIEANGGGAEVRGTCRSLTLRMTDAETLQFVGITGPITLNDDGATTATVNLYGVSTSVTDNTTTATVTDNTISNASINTQADTAISDAFTFSGANVDANIAAMDAGTITAAAIATDAIDADAVADNTIDAGAIASNAITAAKIATDAITSDKIATDAIGAAELATDAIGSDQLAATATTEIRDAVTGGAYALDTDANGRMRVVDGTGAGEINTASGVVEANVAQVDGNAQAATNLKNSSLAVVSGTVAADGSNSATSFKVDATLGAKAANYYGNSDGGMVLVFIDGTLNEWQSRRVTEFNTTTDFITVEEAFNTTPADSDGFVLLGRITELT